MRVLQVEDDATTAKTVELMLRSEGHDCETASLGEEALSLARENDYDLILLDIMLPDIDGYEVLKHLRDNDIQTPVLLQSALIQHERDRGAMGLSDCLIKPFGKEDLITRIETVRGALQPRISDGEDVPPDSEQERRCAPRIKTAMPGAIVCEQLDDIVECLVISLSEGGAAIQPTEMFDCPDRFGLQIEFGPSYECEVRWRHGDKLGVSFLQV